MFNRGYLNESDDSMAEPDDDAKSFTEDHVETEFK